MSGQSRDRERDRGHPLAGSSTLNRLELGRPEQTATDRYKRIEADPQHLDRLLVELFLDQQPTMPEQLVLAGAGQPAVGERQLASLGE